uniref:Uncharacterized protein n=1 Tax=Cacopsylla melanoneura TaxID=428564 RepID=A0A8D9A5T7_9HEMI
MNMLSPLPARRIRLDPNEHDPRVDQEKPPSRLGNKRCFFPEKGIGKGESGRERLSPFSILIISFYFPKLSPFSINSFFLIIYILLFSPFSILLISFYFPDFPLCQFIFPHISFYFASPFFFLKIDLIVNIDLPKVLSFCD